ncbi:MAG: nucleotidyl transferase AbiEii/AbiGii toxin family protein [Thermodesulfobacteriota bacterium]|nr:nucleotidyl transferase AbiEii/AbiGii toxin family protein [Thermodesulfobacteriota bacterium]
MIDTAYFRQATLLLRILPLIQGEKTFALKGGTAINFFIRDLPRLSIDIDLVYLPINERNTALGDISRSLMHVSRKIEHIIPGSKTVLKKMRNTEFYKGMVVRNKDATVKIEPNFVIRGSIFETDKRALCQKAQKIFKMELDAQILSKEELYAGKLCAALDRQHPRDIFDIHILCQHEGITEKTRKAFIVYLISHPRPIVELLNPRIQDIRKLYENEFYGMVNLVIDCDDLIETQKQLAPMLVDALTDEEKQFIVSVKAGVPEWDLLGLKGIEDMPAVRWKLYNISRMDKHKLKLAQKKLHEFLEL